MKGRGIRIRKGSGANAVAYFLGFVWILVTMAPMLLAILSSFKNNTEIYLRPWQLPESWAPVNMKSFH